MSYEPRKPAKLGVENRQAEYKEIPGDIIRTVNTCPKCGGPLQHAACGTSCRLCEWSGVSRSATGQL